MVDFSQLFHTGFVVPDVCAAMDEIGQQLGVTWAEVTEIDMTLATESGVIEPRMVFTYSREGPVHIELLQAVAGTPWTVATATPPIGRQAAHHVGLFSDDVAGESARLAASGAPRVVTYASSSEEARGFAYHRLACGLLVEIVDRARKPDFERWFAGGAFVPA